jgi:hypothetical protein
MAIALACQFSQRNKGVKFNAIAMTVTPSLSGAINTAVAPPLALTIGFKFCLAVSSLLLVGDGRVAIKLRKFSNLP